MLYETRIVQKSGIIPSEDNTPYPNMKEITQEEYFRELHWGIVYIDNRQFWWDGVFFSEHAFLNSDSQGVIAVHDPNQKAMRFFGFAKCWHDWQHTKNIGRCFNRYTCSKCQAEKDVDSSD